MFWPVGLAIFGTGGGKPVSANNSWYDPNSQVLHLEWSGGYSWGDYTIKREFSNPIFD